MVQKITKKIDYQWFITNTDNDRSGRHGFTFKVYADDEDDVILAFALVAAKERVERLEKAQPENINIEICSINDVND